MHQKFTTKELIFIAILAALLFVVGFSVGSGIIAATGIPGSSMLVTGILDLSILTFAALTVRKFGTMGLLYLIYCILAIPTSNGGGPPGFFWKVPLTVIPTLLILDTITYATKYRPIGFIISFPIFTTIAGIGYFTTYYLLGMPEFDQLIGVWWIIATTWIVLGYVGIWLGFTLHKRLKNKRVIKQIQA